MVQPATAPSRDSSFGRLFDALARQRRARHPGQARAGPPRARVPLRRGPPPHRGRARRRQDVARQGDRALDRRHVAPHPVHARPAARPTSPACRCGTARSDEFEFRPGGVFANVVLADEINRASPKTQSALLEAMEERQVTVDAHTYRLPRPFMVIATQNPIELEGTYPAARGAARPLPHAHPDGLPRPRRRARDPRRAGRAHAHRRRARPGGDAADGRRRAHAASSRVHVAPELRGYIVDIVDASRRHPDLVLGASPRGSLALQRAARALAASIGRDVRRPRRREARRPVGARAPRCSSPPTPQLRGVTRRDVVARDPRVGAGAGRDAGSLSRADVPRPARPPILESSRHRSPAAGWSLTGAALRARRSGASSSARSRCWSSGSPRSCWWSRRRSWLRFQAPPDLAVQPAGAPRSAPRGLRGPHRPAGREPAARAPPPSSPPPTGSTRVGARRASWSRRSPPARPRAPRTASRPAGAGRYRVGPLALAVTDPFGLARRSEPSVGDSRPGRAPARARHRGAGRGRAAGSAPSTRATCRRRARW